MNLNASLVITSISTDQNPVLINYAKVCSERKIHFILAGDKKSPADFNIEGCEFLSLNDQKKLPFKLAKKLPDNNYAKKNLAYLKAIKKGCTILVETDDDNSPLSEFWHDRAAEVSGSLIENGDWVNVYNYFSTEDIWPRGFSLKHLDNLPKEITDASTLHFCPIQQSLANNNPDVDAVYRLNGKLPITFSKHHPVILGKASVCPFNSQNTTWFKEAFPLLYLPSYCSFRMTDIWRSFIAQRILSSCNWHVSFHEATVFQQRNEHDLMKDLEQEIIGYLNNDLIVEALNDLKLEPGSAHIADNMIICYKWFVERKLMDSEELNLLEAWLEDLKSLNFFTTTN